MNQNINIKGWARALLIIVPYLFVVGFFQIVGAFVAGQDVSSELVNETTEQHLMISFFGFLGTLSVVYLFTKCVDSMPFNDIGLYLKNHKKGVLLGLLAGLLIMTIGFLILSSSEQIQFIEARFLGGEFFLTILLFLIVSVSEEVLFRGYVLRNLMESMNKFIALFLSAILFALFHSANPNLSLIGNINLFLAGILLGLPYIYTKNLMFPIAFHFSWNFFQSILGFNVSGIDSYSLIEFKTEKDTIYNGGDFGFEGSILSVLFQLLLILLVYLSYKHQNKLKT